MSECIRLAKRSAGDRQLYLDCFDQMRLTLGLDNKASELQPQQDLEDVIAKSKEARHAAGRSGRRRGGTAQADAQRQRRGREGR
jgi:hypothetical protein